VRERTNEKKPQSKDKDARRLRVRTQKKLFPIHKKGEMERTILGNHMQPKAQDSSFKTAARNS